MKTKSQPRQHQAQREHQSDGGGDGGGGDGGGGDGGGDGGGGNDGDCVVILFGMVCFPVNMSRQRYTLSTRQVHAGL